jgi:uncharacterized membrane protein YjjB (DUF3815 family)
MNLLVIHPKVKAAFFAALAVALVSVGNSLTENYKAAWVPVVAALIPVVAGYLKSASVDAVSGIPHDVVDPATDGHDGAVA